MLFALLGGSELFGAKRTLELQECFKNLNTTEPSGREGYRSPHHLGSNIRLLFLRTESVPVIIFSRSCPH